MSVLFENVVLIGVGLIGGSLVLDLKRQQLIGHVHGVDLDAANLERALERHVIQSASTIMDERLSQADLIILATPVGTVAQIAQALKPWLNHTCTLIDVGSTKQTTIDNIARVLPEHFERFVATHPIAGSDRHGAMAAQFRLFENKKLILCPHTQQNSDSYQKIWQLWQATGAVVSELSPSEHDEILAMVSHLPHLIAYSYMHAVVGQKLGEQALDYAGSGFRDFSRIAASHPAIWTDVSFANQDSLLKLIDEQQMQLQRLKTLIKQGDAQALYAYYDQAEQWRAAWPKTSN
ncbi:prephenate dehydrogenase [Vitreoscilla sp. C1]|uniref:prephenate dehydrogenase n=1 Tax=Vitreoscilla sp. (strain C1) TaxID=96942 RepID=UPI00148E9F94|nr:prephenate dehydrogenase/arogenate dehydrogenase family protein [Vitreoscilla sp. C1]QJQ52318.1 prephenate dehydrogenase [Vitreoscilla sp. C1]